MQVQVVGPFPTTLHHGAALSRSMLKRSRWDDASAAPSAAHSAAPTALAPGPCSVRVALAADEERRRRALEKNILYLQRKHLAVEHDDAQHDDACGGDYEDDVMLQMTMMLTVAP